MPRFKHSYDFDGLKHCGFKNSIIHVTITTQAMIAISNLRAPHRMMAVDLKLSMPCQALQTRIVDVVPCTLCRASFELRQQCSKFEFANADP